MTRRVALVLLALLAPLLAHASDSEPPCGRDPLVVLSPASGMLTGPATQTFRAIVVNRDQSACPAREFVASAQWSGFTPSITTRLEGGTDAQSFTLAPGARRRFALTVTVPADTPPGVYYPIVGAGPSLDEVWIDYAVLTP